jgi:cytochrome c biogenesis protein CcdA
LKKRILLLSVLIFATILSILVEASPNEEWRLVNRITSNTWSITKVVSSPSGNFIAAIYQENGINKLAIYNSSLKPVKQVTLENTFSGDAYFLSDGFLILVFFKRLSGNVPLTEIAIYNPQIDKTLLKVDLPGTTINEIRKALVTGNYLLLLTQNYIFWIDIKAATYTAVPDTPINQGLQMVETSRGIVFLTIETFCHICLSLNQKVIRIYQWTPYAYQPFQYDHVLAIVNLDPYIGILFDNGTLGIYEISTGLTRTSAIYNLTLNSPGVSLPDYKFLYSATISTPTKLVIFDVLHDTRYEVMVPVTYIKGDSLATYVYDDGLYLVVNKNQNQIAIGNFTSRDPPYLLNTTTSMIVGISSGRDTLVVYDYRTIELYKKTSREVQNYELTLEVADETGASIANFTVEINGTKHTSKTNTFTLTLKEGTYKIIISKPGYQQYAFTTKLTSNETRRIILQKTRYTLRIHASSNAGQPEIYILDGTRALCRGIGYAEAKVLPGNYTVLAILLNNTYQAPVQVRNDTEVYIILNIEERPIFPPNLHGNTQNQTTINENNTIVIVYGSDTCAECRALKNQLKLLGINFTFKDISNKTYLQEYQSLYDMLPTKTIYQIPFTLLFRGKHLKAIIIGLPSSQSLKEILTERDVNSTWLYLGDQKQEVTLDSSVFYTLATRGLSLVNTTGNALPQPPKNNTGTTTPTPTPQDIYHVLPIIATLALADSINPCTFMVFSALVLAVASFSGTRKAIYTSASFIGAVYLSYLLLGIGLIRFVAMFTQLRYLLALLVLIAGIYEITNATQLHKMKGLAQTLKLPKTFSNIQAKLNTLQATLLTRAQKGSMILSFLAGTLVSFTLLPCSSGPYLVAALMVSKLPFNITLACLLIYNMIFVSPLILISAAIILGGKLLATMDMASIKINQLRKYTSLLLGLALIILALWIILSP